MVLTHRKDIIPFRISPMLATLVDWPFHKPNWIYEEKYDGIRILAYKEGNRVSLLSRNNKNRTKDFPDIVGAIANLGPAHCCWTARLLFSTSAEFRVFNFCSREKAQRSMRCSTAFMPMARIFDG